MTKISKGKLTNVDDLEKQVARNGGVLMVEMGELRKLLSVGRLGPNVCEEISNRLRSVGLQHSPDPLPTYQHLWAIVFKAGTGFARRADAILRPSPEKEEIIKKLIN